MSVLYFVVGGLAAGLLLTHLGILPKTITPAVPPPPVLPATTIPSVTEAITAPATITGSQLAAIVGSSVGAAMTPAVTTAAVAPTVAAVSGAAASPVVTGSQVAAIAKSLTTAGGIVKGLTGLFAGGEEEKKVTPTGVTTGEAPADNRYLIYGGIAGGILLLILLVAIAR